MRRDTIFYKLFKQFPSLLFELGDEPPPEADSYVFESVEVKETAFRMDGVFLPPANAVSQVVFLQKCNFKKMKIYIFASFRNYRCFCIAILFVMMIGMG